MKYSKEVVELAKKMYPILQKAFDHEGDVFGMLHNDAVDLDCELENILKDEA